MKHHRLTHNGFHSLVKAPVDTKLTMQAYLASTFQNIQLYQTLTLYWEFYCLLGDAM
jgi:hypothetical protein